MESLHHFTQKEKTLLYCKVYCSLKPGCYFDYFARSDEEELWFRNELKQLKARQDIPDSELCHYDTPLTVEHETQALREVGFLTVEILDRWGATYMLKAGK